MRNIEDLLQGINIGIAVGLALSNNKTNALELYKNIMQNSVLPTETHIKNYTEMLRNHASISFDNKNYNEAVLQYLDLFKESELEPDEYKNVALCLFELNQKEAGLGFLDLYEKSSENYFETQKTLGWIYFNVLKEYEKAILHYEKAIKIFPDDPEVHNTLGHIYVLHHKDNALDKQLSCFMNAHNLRKNTRLYIRNIIFTLYRQERWNEVENFYSMLLNLNPTHADYYYYGCFLISQKRFKEGYYYLQHRFQKEDDEKSIIPAVLPQEKYWKGESLTNKTILVHCEQGFGDSIMYSRFIKPLSKLAKKVYFIVQEELFTLINNSNLGCEVYSTNFELSKLEYDFYTTTLDLPLYLDIDANNIPFKEGYLLAKPLDLPSNKLKIGFAYQGNEKLKSNERDVDLKKLEPIFEIPDCEFYSLQVDGEDVLPDNITNLAKDFNTFQDTAQAINAMDIIISTDNVVLNLAGALGKKTFGLFNRFVEYRWFDLKENKQCPWYKNILVFKNKKQDDWNDSIELLIKEINRIKEGLL